MSEQKIADMKASEESQKELLAWCMGQVEIIKNLMEKGRFNDERELLYDWRGKPVTKPRIPRRVGDSLDGKRSNLVSTKRLSKKPTRMVNTFKARKAAEKKAEEEAGEYKRE